MELDETSARVQHFSAFVMQLYSNSTVTKEETDRLAQNDLLMESIKGLEMLEV